MSIELYGTVRCVNAGEVFIASDGHPNGMPFDSIREQEFQQADVVAIPGLRVKYRREYNTAGAYPEAALVGVQCECWKYV